MTQTTIAPGEILVPDVDLEAWLAGDVEATCEVQVGLLIFRRLGAPCALPAQWLMYVRRDHCRCRPRNQGVFVADECRKLIDLVGRLECGVPLWCSAPVTITWLERTI